MKRVFAAGFLLVACAAMVFAVPGRESCAADKKTAPPSASQPPVMAIIDVQRVLEDSLAAKSVQRQLEVQRSKFQDEISGEETGLRDAEKELAGMRETAPPAVFAEKEQLLRQRFLKVERRVQVRRKVLDQAFTDSMNTVRKELLSIVSALAGERSINVVLIKQQTLWNDEGMDITEEVLSRLNRALPEVQVKVAPEEAEKPQPDKPVNTLLKKKKR